MNDLSQSDIDKINAMFSKPQPKERKTKSQQSYVMCASCGECPPTIFRVLCEKCQALVDTAFLEATTRVL